MHYFEIIFLFFTFFRKSMQSRAKSIDDAALSTNVKVVSIYVTSYMYNCAYDTTDYANKKIFLFMHFDRKKLYSQYKCVMLQHG